MTRRLPIIILSFLLSIFNFQVIAQTLTLDDAIKQGLDNNRQLKISGLKVQQAAIKYQEAVDQTIPSLKANLGYTRLSDLSPPLIQFPGFPEPVALFPIYVNNYIGKVSLSETIFSGFRLKYAKESQHLLEEATKLDAAKDKDEVVYNIVAAYLNLYKLNQSLAIVDENLKQQAEQIRISSKLEEQGVALHNDVLRFQLQQANTQLAKLDLQNNLSVASYNFNILIGRSETSKVDIDTNTVKDIPALKPLDAYIADALKNRADLQALNTRNKSLENNLKIAQNSYYPIIGVNGSWYDQRPNPRVIPPQDKFVATWEAGIALNWDLTNLYSNRHNVADVNIQLQQSQEGERQLQDVVKMDVNQNYVACLQSAEKIKVMQTALQQAEENFKIMNSRYTNGLALTTDYLDANASVLQARINLALAKADATSNYYKLLKATGAINNGR